MNIKYFLLTLFIFLNIIYIGNCQVGNLCVNCLKLNEKCNGLGSCASDTVCASETVNFSENPKCSVPKELNEECKNDEQCRLGTKCLMINGNGFCTDIKFAQVNEECETDLNCSGNQIKCINGICTKPNKNDTNNNEKDTVPCGMENPCPFGQYCQLATKSCRDQLKPGDTCLQSTQCPIGHFCDISSNKCQKAFTLSEGDKCQSYSLDQCNSDHDLYCTTGFCEKLNTTITGECLRMENLCAPFHTCLCSDFKCHPNREFGHEFTAKLNKFYNCMQKHKCQFTYNRFSNNSCITRNCGLEFCNYNQAIVPDNQLSCGRTSIKNYCKIVLENNHHHQETTSESSIKHKKFKNHSKEDLIFYSVSIPFFILILSIGLEIKLNRNEKNKL